MPDVLNEQFDVVYTPNGVLGWLPDIRRWAQVVAQFVRPGGRFYITEIHPVAQAFEEEGIEPGELVLRYPYWEHREPLSFPTQGSYADSNAHVGRRHDLTVYDALPCRGTNPNPQGEKPCPSDKTEDAKAQQQKSENEFNNTCNGSD